MFWLDLLILLTTILALVLMFFVLVPSLRAAAYGRADQPSSPPSGAHVAIVLVGLFVLFQGTMAIYYFVQLRPWIQQNGGSEAFGFILALVALLLVSVILLYRLGNNEPGRGMLPWASSTHRYSVALRHVI